MKKYIVYLFLLSNLFVFNLAISNENFVIDFSKVLNESTAGKQAQNFLKNKLNKDVEKFNAEEKKLRDEEKDLINQKKIISAEEYKNKVDDLRQKVGNLQKKRADSLNSIAKTRADARAQLLKSLNPILEKFMNEKGITLVFDKSVVLANKRELDITDQIIELLNQNLKSLNLK